MTHPIDTRSRRSLTGRFIICWLTGSTLPSVRLAAEDTPYISGNDYPARSAAEVSWRAAHRPAEPDYPKDAMAYYAARLLTGRDTDWAIGSLNHMMESANKGKLDPFHLHAIMHGLLLCREKYPADLQQKFLHFAQRWDYTKPIGVSLNYELMRDGGGILAAQTWPDMHDAAGNDAKKITQMCKARLMQLFAENTARNDTEYESPLYYGTDMMAVRMLAEFSEDQQIKAAASMTLEWMLVQVGSYWHDGYFISSAGRAKYWGSSNTSPDSVGATTGMGYLLYGGLRPQRLGDVPQCFWLAHPGREVPYQMLSAWQAALPVQRVVLGAVDWPQHKSIVRKYAWMTERYGLASERTDGSPADSYQYKESRRVMLKWDSTSPQSTFTILQASRRRPSEKIANAFGYGENPYAQVMQHEGTLIGIYKVPEDYGFWKMQVPFVNNGAILRRAEKDGWVFCHGGSVLFAFRSLKPAVWAKPDARQHLDLLECEDRLNGYILQTAVVSAFSAPSQEAELSRFMSAVLEKSRIEDHLTDTPPRLVYANLQGQRLEMTWHPPDQKYTDQCLLDGKVLGYGTYPLLDLPSAHQPLGGPLSIKLPDGKARTYDFNHWTISK